MASEIVLFNKSMKWGPILPRNVKILGKLKFSTGIIESVTFMRFAIRILQTRIKIAVVVCRYHGRFVFYHGCSHDSVDRWS